MAHFSQKPGHKVAEDDSFVGFVVIWRRGNAGRGPEVSLPFVKLVVASASVEEKHSGGAIDKPSSVECLDAPLVHRFDGGHHSLVFGLELFNLNSRLNARQSSVPYLYKQRMALMLTELRLRGPSRVYAEPYSAVVTCALDLRTE